MTFPGDEFYESDNNPPGPDGAAPIGNFGPYGPAFYHSGGLITARIAPAVAPPPQSRESAERERRRQERIARQRGGSVTIGQVVEEWARPIMDAVTQRLTRKQKTE